MKKVTLFLYLLPSLLFAQINESDSVRFHGLFSLTGAWQEGNAEVLIVRGKAEASWRPVKNWVLKTQNAYLYQEFFNNKADEDIYSRNFLYLRPENRVYPFVLQLIQTNFRRKINYRYFTGLGTIFQVVHKKITF